MDDKLIIVMVGLPARGKSYTSNNLCRFLNWCGVNCKVFNSGDYRRKIMNGFQDSNFFNFDIKENFDKKEEISRICFEELLKWLDDSGKVAIFDATNSNKIRRNFIIKKSNGKNVIFLELITNNEQIINRNIELKSLSADYIGKDKDYSMKDFKQREEFYKKSYESIDDSENLSYIKIVNFTEKLLLKDIVGINESLVTSYLMNLRLNKHPIYLTRHGQSINNINSIIGGDCLLTESGIEYSKKLQRFINEDINRDFVIFTSCLKRTIETVKLFSQNKIETRLLNEIHGGICENMSYLDIEEKYPEINKNRKKDKLRYRYPEGESYIDLLERLRYFVLQLGSYKKPILIVAHNAIIKVLLGYFQEIPHEEIPHLNINLHEVIKLTPNSKSYNIENIKL